MSALNTGGPAFCTLEHDGMTLRDYFAAKAMQALVSADVFTSTAHPQVTARAAYQLADNMLTARES